MLPQKPAPRRRKLKLRRIIGWSGLLFLGTVTVFGVVPQVGANAEKTDIVVEEITLPTTTPSGNATTFWRDDQVQRHDTIAKLLHRLNVKDNEAERYLHSASAVASLRKLAPGKKVLAETDADGGLLALRYPADNGSQMLVERTGSGFATRVLPAQLEHRLFVCTGEIRTTLFAATDQANLPDPAANELANIFGSYIDFHHDLKPGDRFSVIYEVDYSDAEPVRAGRILAAEFINRSKSYRALYYQPEGERGSYYSPDGRNMTRTFLRSPVEFSRISSGFTIARYHPILHKWRAHRGVDFAAPMGAKVKSTAEGIVDFVGVQTGYGNVIIIKHQGRFSTVYGHLSRFAHNLHSGQHVAQGEVIGYVGKSGWATGPHLHYEFRVDGQQRNPLLVAQPDAEALSDAQKDAFAAATHDLNARLWMLHNTILAEAN